MNPRLVEPGFVVVSAYTRTSPLVPLRRTTTATTTRRFSGDMGWSPDDNPARPGRASRAGYFFAYFFTSIVNSAP
jgi:hypothetical protein